METLKQQHQNTKIPRRITEMDYAKESLRLHGEWKGNIGPEAGMPVMEGKCALFKAFGDVDAFPLCIKSNDVD